MNFTSKTAPATAATAPASVARAAAKSGGVNKTLVLALLCTVQFMLVLDGTIMSVALASIGRELRLSAGELQWIINAYSLAFGGFLLLGGRAADLLGRRRVFLFGLAIFTLASLAGGFAMSGTWLTITRSIQGFGGALVSPAALSILTVTFAEGPERNRALGTWGAIAGSGAVCGVLLGGVLTTYLGWSWVLWVNVPIGATAVWLGSRWLPASSGDAPTQKNFDFMGAFTITSALIALVYATVNTAQFGWVSARTLGTYALGLALISAFVWIEKRSSAPLVDFSIFKMPTLLGANLIAFMQSTGPMGTLFFLSFYLQQVLNFTPLETGAAFVPFALSSGVASLFASRMVQKTSVLTMVTCGLGLMITGLLLLTRVATLPDGGSFWGVLAPTILIGLGLTTTGVPMTLAAVAGVPPERSGLASGLLSTSQQIGGAVILAVMVTFADARAKTVLASGASKADSLVASYHLAFGIGASLLMVGVCIAWYFLRDVKAPNAAKSVGDAGVRQSGRS